MIQSWDRSWLFVPAVAVDVQVGLGETAQAALPLEPAGRLRGRVEPQGAVEPKLLAGLILRAIGSVERVAVTDADGTFDFGLLPVGDYRVEMTPESLREHGLAAMPPLQLVVHVIRGGRDIIVLKVRKLTARERFGT